MEIDLHGYNIEQATATVINALFEFDSNHYINSLKIITGHGEKIINITVLNILEKEYRKYKEGNGFFIVYR